jgi:5-methylcytosine-specific restriction endonuclease McrA
MKHYHDYDTIQCFFTMSRATISDSTRYSILVRQSFRCKGIPSYTCPFNGRCFDEAGYDVDHVIPLVDGGSNESDNLQALCPCCHRVKTMRENKARSARLAEEDRKQQEYKRRFATFRKKYPTIFQSAKDFWSVYEAWESDTKVFSKKKVILAMANSAYGF